jgi:uncharacterized membrane protein YccC
MGMLLGNPALGWASAVALFVSVADKGGAYWTRFQFSLSLAVSASAAIFLAAKLAPSLPASVAGMFGICLIAGLAAGAGDRAITWGRMLAISFAMSLPFPETAPGEALSRSLYALSGGVWAMILSLSLWPLRFFRPAREAVASLYDALALQAEAIALRLEATPGGAWAAGLEAASARIHLLSRDVGSVLLASRRGIAGRRRRGEALLVLYEGAQRMLAILEGIPAALEPRKGASPNHGLEEASAALLRRFAAEARGIGARAVGESVGGLGAPYRLPVAAHSPRWQAAAILFERLGEYVAATWMESVGLGVDVGVRRAAWGPSPLGRIRAGLQPGSPIFRHALRLATVASLAAALGKVLQFQMSQWVTVSAIAILHPHSSETLRRGLQRVGGAVLGGSVAALLAASFQGTIGLVALVFVFAFLGVACAPLNYGFYVALMTPAFVLLSELRGLGDWHLAGIRVLHTAIGGALALLGMRLFWPGSEWKGVVRYIASGLSTAGAYLEVAAEGASRERLRACRRAVGLATAQAEEAMRRVLEGEVPEADRAAPLLSAVTYLGRLDASITALASLRRGRTFPVAIAQPGRGALEDLAAAVERGAAPRPLDLPRVPTPPAVPAPDSAADSAAHAASALQHRIVRQIEVLHGVTADLQLARWLSRLHGSGRLLDLLPPRRRLHP